MVQRVDIFHPAFVIFVLAVAVAVVHLLQKSNHPRAAIEPHVLENTIFIPLVAPPYSKRLQVSMIQTHIERIFNTAAIPSRIFLGIYDCADEIQVPSEIQKNVRILRHMDLRFPFRESNARAILLSQLYDQEKYSFLIPYGATLTSHWDEILVNNQQTEDLFHGDELSIITSMCKFNNLLEDTRADFLCLQEMQGARLSLCTKQTLQRADTSTPSLFWSPNYSFCHGSVFERVPLLRDISDSMETTLNCVRLWTHGFRFVVPDRIVAATQGAYRATQTAYRSPTALLGSARSMTEFEAYAGVSFKNSVATPRSRAGLSPKAQVGECTCKYGSIELARLQLFEQS
tara:strand:+ start:529 stop:1560 length:1032 start_codon:yes stop_codon:yes gene_type:complete